MDKLVTIKANATGITRREVFDGRTHLVVPAVLAVAGVLNEALVPADELGRFAESWNGRPVPVLHPERDGIPVSANFPDILERSIGTIFNARMDGDKLRAELWLDEGKADRLGYTSLISSLSAGEMVEVSTGYFPDEVVQNGDFNGLPYKFVHRNLRPDHLALLPGQLGACSIADGCGAPRINRGIKMKVNEAMNTIRAALGMKTNCCEDSNMNQLVKQAEKLVTNGGLTAKQFQSLQEMDEPTLTMVSALIEAMLKTAPPAAAEVEEVVEPEEELPAAQATAPAVNIDKLVANQVAEHFRRHNVTSKLVANERCPFSADELATMDIAHLEKLEASIRPVDYSGQGGFAANSNAIDANVSPLRINRGVLAPRTNKEA